MTVRRLLAELDSREISEWAAYFRIENEAWETSKGGGTKKRDPAELSRDLIKAFKRYEGRNGNAAN